MRTLRYLVAASLAACAPSLQTTPLVGPPVTKAPAVVEVLEAPPERATAVVGLGVAELDTEGPRPQSPSAELVASFRGAAAERGADVVVIELMETRWRRAYYSTMLRYLAPGESSSDGPRACDHPDTVAALEAARQEAAACLGKAKKDRPGLFGKVTIRFEVDAFGGIRRAAPTPDSTRDTQVQMCILEPLFTGKTYGPAKPFSCRSEVTVEVPAVAAEPEAG
jgi:hypothetical protein